MPAPQIKKVNPYALNRQTVKPDEHTITDADFPDDPVIISLRPIDRTEQGEALSKADDLMSEWGGKDEQGVQRVYLARDVPVILSRIIAINCCYLEVMQRGVPKDQRYDFDELLGIAKFMSDAWGQLMMLMVEYMPGKKGVRPEALTSVLSQAASESSLETEELTPS